MEAYSSSYPASKSHSLLHSVRKAQAKPWKKAPVAPPAPTPIRVYKVDAINFRDLVQRLTGAPEFIPQLHHQLFQSTPPKTMLSSRDNVVAPSSTVSSTNWGHQPQTLELNLSPSTSYNWCSVPRTLEPGRVL
ncbi:hypothetical protein PHAVU_002G009700 [Phaseolus vulgaris]|uniref:VQ domain-containing protein n=1 Tax=Phaseolus vulgaris TaxID=3885 RepID=V7CEU6_PHAVU|nr:hypothetical protein PHAVU_002G009700g [Phaseolus vulgaris]ESW28692.1 hypothetical protein PHAVU_002G009700g [Phaseolus vulgaris]